MGINFYIEYNTIKSMLIVEQNGKSVSKYSQFSHCDGKPFAQWYKNISEYCFNEANGMYSVHFVGGLILKAILEKELVSTKGCTEFSYEPEIITGVARMYLAEELLRYSKVGVREYRVDISFDSNKMQLFKQVEKLVKNTDTLQFLDLKDLPIYLRISKKLNYASNIIIISSMEEYYRISNGWNGSSPKLVIIVKNGVLRFLEESNSCFLFSCENSEIHKLVKAWISDVLFPEYALTVIRNLKNCHKWNTIDYQSALKMIDALSGNTPYLDLAVTDNIEISSVGKFKLTKFPKDVPCRMYSSNAQIVLLGNGGIIKPIGEGSAEIIVEVKNHPTIRTSRSVTVYKYKKVQKIHLATANASVVVGDQFIVTRELIPRDAHNIALGKWNIIPNDGMKMVSNKQGIFQAVKPGKCEIVYSVGNIKERLVFQVSDKPSSINFIDKSLSVKLYDTTQRATAVIYPHGAKGGIIKYKISNTNVLDFDSNNGQIIPKQEGNAVITAILLDSNGSIIDDSNCNVSILPPKDVITPDGALVLLIVSLIGSLLLINNECRLLCGVTGLVGAIWYSFKEKSKRGYVISILLFLLTVFLIWMGGKI